MNLGAPEIILLLAFAALFAAVIAVAAISRAARSGTRGGAPAATGRASSPQELDARVRHLAATGQQIHAIKLLRQHTGMGLKQAKDAVDGLAHGRPIHHPALRPQPARHTSDHSGDLAARVRALKGDGRTEQAVFLVRGETGMDHDEATAFVDAVRDHPEARPEARPAGDA
ncbi:ribosomal protein L7/L12 [Nonomuraea sp. NPDC050691]|uniref:ribosomal protein L7/L12 n=1 Tax=Nonomuraea sp. NPDC050691 TaxID=3155661 RepID=UPI00341007FB